MNLKKNLIEHSIAVITFLAVTFILFHPQFLENKELSQHDILQWKGGAKEIIDYQEKTGKQALWTNSMFSGMPAYLVSLSFEYDPVKIFYKVFSLWLPSPANKIFLAFVCFYIMLIAYKVKPIFSIVGALSFGLSSYLIIGLSAGHNAKIAAIAFIPMIVAGIHLIFSGKKNWGMLLLMIGLACQLYVNHLQITYYTLIIALVYSLSELIFHIKSKTTSSLLKLSPYFIAAIVIAVGSNMGRILTVLEYSKYSSRGPSELSTTNADNTDNIKGLDKDYVFQYSYGISEPLVMLIPNFLGGSSQQELDEDSNLAKAMRSKGVQRGQIKEQIRSVPTYWGDQPLSAPYYAGAIIVFLFVLGLLTVESRHRYWLLATVIISVMLSWGYNFSAFNDLMYHYLPGYSKFRSVTFIIIIAIFSINLLGILALNKITTSAFDNAMKKKFLIAIAITGGFSLLLILFASMRNYVGSVDAQLSNLPDWFIEALRNDRKSLLRADAFRTLIFILLSAAAIWLFLIKKIKLKMLGAILVVLTCFDSIGIDKRFLTKASFVRNSGKVNQTAANQSIKNDKEHYRVLNLNNPFNEANTSYFHNSIGGYHGAKLRRYQDLIERSISPQINSMVGKLRNGQTDFSSEQVLNMLNAKYVKFGEQKENVIVNGNVFGNAWFVSDIANVNSPDEEIAKLNSVNLKNSAIIDQNKFKLNKSSFDNSGTITLQKYSPNLITYKTTGGSSNRLAVFSEIYYPEGWSAKIDGKETSISRANYVLRALQIPAGDHTVEFSFRPASYYTGEIIMLISSSIIFILFIGLSYLEYKKESAPVTE